MWANKEIEPILHMVDKVEIWIQNNYWKKFNVLLKIWKIKFMEFIKNFRRVKFFTLFKFYNLSGALSYKFT